MCGLGLELLRLLLGLGHRLAHLRRHAGNEGGLARLGVHVRERHGRKRGRHLHHTRLWLDVEATALGRVAIVHLLGHTSWHLHAWNRTVTGRRSRDAWGVSRRIRITLAVSIVSIWETAVRVQRALAVIAGHVAAVATGPSTRQG